ncbi:UNVERIFIED_CONTAM: Retrovirus-related Pol polyprotein from transposon RE1 [Sesamum radiatum]|uniref:Retrovirus-related Pol polyprotein from transposon RE1 n=1 Tax=Sesamum radiatum TaxID=300843 RepID=A0AAW2WGN7_SESRA
MHSCFVEGLSVLEEPKDFCEAQEKQEWREAMQQEIDALERNKTWEISYLPQGKNVIGCRWIYKIKLRPDGTIERCKARLVAKGFSQVEGIDYNDCFAPVAKTVTVRLFLIVAAGRGWPLHHLDVNSAFLHGSLDEVIYMDAPEGYKIPPGQVCRLKKSLYGLQLIALLVYVDDILVATPTEILIQEVKGYLDRLFSIKDLGPAKYFLGLELARSPQGLIATQNKYALDIIKDARLLQGRSVTTPLPPGLKFGTESGMALQDPGKYRRLIGRLLYQGFTRPEICHAAQQLSQHVQHPCQQHLDAALHLVRYLKASPSTGLFFPSNNDFKLKAYCDVDWAACPPSRRSLTGYCIFLGMSLVSWKTKKQTTVVRSSIEAEYRSMAATTCEITWVTNLLQDLGVRIDTPVPFFCDNKAPHFYTYDPSWA